jgi:hypothetical protein
VKNKLWSFDDLAAQAEKAIKQARSEPKWVRDTMLCLAAARLWSMRAEYAYLHGPIEAADFAEVDHKMNILLGIQEKETA